MRKKITVITMGQSPANPETNDVYRTLASESDVKLCGILDGMSESDVNAVAPESGEPFIVTSLLTGREVRIAERNAMRLVNDRLLNAEHENRDAALILCTGHFDIPQLHMPVFIPERILFSLLRATGVKRLGIIVPKPAQIEASMLYYSAFSPTICAASPYGPIENIEIAAAAFRDSGVDMVMADCMGFTEELGELMRSASEKPVLVPRVLLPAILKAVICV